MLFFARLISARPAHAGKTLHGGAGPRGTRILIGGGGRSRRSEIGAEVLEGGVQVDRFAVNKRLRQLLEHRGGGGKTETGVWQLPRPGLLLLGGLLAVRYT